MAASPAAGRQRRGRQIVNWPCPGAGAGGYAADDWVGHTVPMVRLLIILKVWWAGWERRRGGSAEQQSCLGVMLTAGPCDERQLPWGQRRPGNSVCTWLCLCSCTYGVSVSRLQAFLLAAARCAFASHCKVRVGLIAQCQNGGQEGGS